MLQNQAKYNLHFNSAIFIKICTQLVHIAFEAGGKNKGLKQIQGIDKAFIVKDDIELGYLNTIPLWQFGLTY